MGRADTSPLYCHQKKRMQAKDMLPLGHSTVHPLVNFPGACVCVCTHVCIQNLGPLVNQLWVRSTMCLTLG